MGDLLLVEEAATRLRCDPCTIRRYVKAGKLQATRPGNRLLIDAASVDRLVTASTVVPAPAAKRPAPAPARPRTQPVVSFRERAKLARTKGERSQA